jgi:nucleoside-diphosphate-sugar epimerase
MNQYRKTALVLGAGGFIGSHMIKRLKSEGYWVRGVDLKRPEFSETEANEFIVGDLRDPLFVERVIQFKGELGNFYKHVPSRYLQGFDEIYQFAADMGGSGFIGREIIPFLSNDGWDVVSPTSSELRLDFSEDVDSFFDDQYYDAIIHSAIVGVLG